MLYRKIDDVSGAYIADDGTRCVLLTARGVPAQYRELYTSFGSLDDCLAAWGLTYDPLPEPQPEN